MTDRVKKALAKLFHPPLRVLFSLPPAVLALLIFIFATDNSKSAPAYPIYFMSAYALVVVLIALPRFARRLKSAVMKSKAMKKVSSLPFIGRYLTDIVYRGSVSIYQGAIINFLYVVFRAYSGIRYTSVWFVSMAVYYLVLGGLRAYLIYGYRHNANEYRCYRLVAWLLFLLNIPMGGMIVLMVRTNSGFSYPGHIIYLSALYTFFTMISSTASLIRFRRMGSPILSAAKVLNFVAAMMSVLGLQTAMISRFSDNGEEYRILMNTVTGSFVYGIVIILAIYMLLHSGGKIKEGDAGE